MIGVERHVGRRRRRRRRATAPLAAARLGGSGYGTSSGSIRTISAAVAHDLAARRAASARATRPRRDGLDRHACGRSRRTTSSAARRTPASDTDASDDEQRRRSSRALRSSCAIVYRLDEGVEHADAQLARIAAAPSPVTSAGTNVLSTVNLQLDHVAGAELRRRERDLAQQRALRRQRELVERLVADADRRPAAAP